MRTIVILTTMAVCAAGAAPAVIAQAASTRSTPAPLRLTVDEAVKMALDQNIDLSAVRMEPQISDAGVASAAGAFRPVFNTSFERNRQVDPPASFLIPTATRATAVTSAFGLDQKLPWLGTAYSISWNATHTDSNSFLNTFNPVLQSGLSLAVSQPLLRGLKIDAARQQLEASRISRDVADTEVRETVVQTEAGVKRAYWNLVSARSTVDARKSALDLAEELVRVNRAKVDVGQSPPLDLVAAEAEVASDQEQLIVAETAVKQIEDELRVLIFDTSDAGTWRVPIEPAEAPPSTAAAPDLDAAVANALRDRADLARARKTIENARLSVKFTRSERMPDVRLNANYQASGLGGTEVLRAGPFPGTIVGAGTPVAFGSVLNQLFTGAYPTWTLGVSVNYPIGQATEEANYARATLQQQQAQQRLKSAESHVVQEVRDAWRQIEMNGRRIETTRAARELAEQRLDAERKRFDVGMSTSFLVIQAQRDLTQAKTNELAAMLAYDLALVDFEAVQQAEPAAGSAVIAAPAATTPASSVPPASR